MPGPSFKRGSAFYCSLVTAAVFLPHSACKRGEERRRRFSVANLHESSLIARVSKVQLVLA